MNSSGSSSDSEDELGTSASVQEEKREFEAGLSDLRHKLAQEVILEEEEGKSKALVNLRVWSSVFGRPRHFFEVIFGLSRVYYP